ncbi:hypothetical protein FDP41_006867 [Naegleria fowleri]|uniref:folate gamma-glutamyl hydrolase n=1 Tax=Naegleria fowleri TaxID=5763 RepID=A0A6A5BAM3_NAEFO|nr:uncharacterized protein FDP41_006867 [Naegleria fowleri]KAF0974257.1 hypothetical protein FDP41_006867 [Naegleria fowleri]
MATPKSLSFTIIGTTKAFLLLLLVVTGAVILPFCDSTFLYAFPIGSLTARKAPTLNDRPIIGIMAQPTGSALSRFGKTYIAASYVKWIESGGARVVPIPYNLPESELRRLFESLNGVVFPGGGTDLTNDDGSWTPYLKSLGLFVNWSIQSFNNGGDYFPIWGTCLGMQSLSIILSGNPYILEGGFDSYNISMPLNFTHSIPETRQISRIFNTCPLTYMTTLSTKAVTLNNHHYGVPISNWNSNQKINTENNLLATNRDRKGREFVSLFENKRYPFFASQFHPEKIAFEWCHEDIDHSYDSLLANQYFSQFFVNECRKSQHKFKTESDELKALIYNYTPVYTYPVEPDFAQCYFF